MRFSLNKHCSGVVAFVIFILEIVPVLSLQNATSNVIGEFQHDKRNITISNSDHSTVNITVDPYTHETLYIRNSTTKQEVGSINGLRKNRRRKMKRNGRQRKGVITTTELPSSTNQTEQNPNIKKKRRRKLRRRKHRKNRRKQQLLENSNILEVTTAKGMIFSTNTNSNSTINELIRKLNENPEDNFEEFRRKHSNRSSTGKARRKKIANLVAPIPVTSKFALHDNITLHVDMGNGTYYKNPIKRNNRCRKKKGGCTHFCNPRGKIKCFCLKGFALATDQKTCIDIDECKTNNGGCEKECHNTLGSYECRCPDGLRRADDLKSCDDINECLLRNGHGPCQDTCENTFGSYKCSCEGLNGTILREDEHSCLDIDECVINNGGCSHGCINTIGKSFCFCPDGMELSSDWKTCQDTNECEEDSIKASCRNCINTEGSYKCLDSIDYLNDQPSTGTTCSPLPLPQLGYLSCSRDDAQKVYTKTGRERITNSPGTICKLQCPIGFKMVGLFYVVCGSSGRWEGRTEAKCIQAEPPTLLCPTTQNFTVDRKTNMAFVTFPSPKTNINWRYVKSSPIWAKDLNASLEAGHYEINFSAVDPNSKLSASCFFEIIVDN